MEEELESRIEYLSKRHDTLMEMLKEVSLEKEQAEEALHKEYVKKMDDVIPKYTAKLERLKAYILAWREVARGKTDIKFAFQKREPYRDDFHDPMRDPLDWKICEYDLLGFWDHLEIIFDYSNENVKEFVKRWMFDNIKNSCFEDDINELFGFRTE